MATPRVQRKLISDITKVETGLISSKEIYRLFHTVKLNSFSIEQNLAMGMKGEGLNSPRVKLKSVQVHHKN